MATTVSTIRKQFGSRNILDTATAELQETRQDRLLRYLLNWSYFLNRQYDELVQSATTESKAARRKKEILYAKIKPLFNMCGQAARLDAASVLAYPVTVSSEQVAIEKGISEVWRRSQLQSQLHKLVLYGAVYGDVFLRLANETTKPQIIVHPPTEFDVRYDPHDATRIDMAELSYNFFENVATSVGMRTYTLRIYPDRYETYLDGKPHTYDARGQTWDNPLGFVPAVHIKLIDIGNLYGAATFHEILPQLDAVNEIASQMAEIIRIHSEPQIVAYNVKKGSLSKGSDDKATTTVWYANRVAGSEVDPKVTLLEWSGNIQGMTEYIDWCKRNAEEQLEEWHIKRVREQNQVSGYSVELQLVELLLKLQSMRRQAVQGLRRINGMAMVAQGKGDSIEAVANAHEITAGSILPSNEAEEADLTYRDMQNGLIDRVEALIRRGYDREEAKKLIEAVDKEQERKFMMGAAWPPDEDES